jgi:DNA-3-methyladenine glycosylase II
MWKNAEKYLSKDKYIAPLIKKHGSCKIKPRRKKDYFRSLVREIIGQQLHSKAAASIFGKVKEKCGGEVVPEKITRIRDSTLRKCGLSFAKIKYVKDLARKVKSKEVEIDKMDKLSDEKIVEELIAVHGIGQWTADMFLMFTLGRSDVFPVGDLAIRRGLRKLVSDNIEATDMIEFAKRWKPYRTIASWYIWASIDD